MKFGLCSRYGIASTLRVALGVLILVLAVPFVSFGQSPFDGTWKDNLDQSKFSPKPLEFSLNNGAYDCISCVPEVHVKADGSDQAVSGQPYDTLAVKEVDARTVQFIAKKNGKTSWEQTRTASEDGKTETIKTTRSAEQHEPSDRGSNPGTRRKSAGRRQCNFRVLEDQEGERVREWTDVHLQGQR